MKAKTEAAISMTETAYDLGIARAEWLAHVIEAGRPLVDCGLGVIGLLGAKPVRPGPLEIEEIHVDAGASDFLANVMRLMAALPQEQLYAQTESGIRLLSELMRQEAGYVEAWGQHIDYAHDAIGITALDTDGRGIHLMAASPEIKVLTGRERSLWRMLAAHLCAGLRLRTKPPTRAESLPRGAEAVIDPTKFEIRDAAQTADDAPTLEAMRTAAARVDRARGRLRKTDPDRALKIWQALVRGRWSMVDWFDTDERRYVLALPNPPRIRDPRGLTEREIQVAEYAALGERHKIIGYRLGLSRSAVTTALRSAMRKLGVKTQAQLVERLRTVRPKDSA